MNIIKELEKIYNEEEALFIKNYVDLGCCQYNDIGKLVAKTRLDTLQYLIRKFLIQEEEWISCKDKLPPKRTLVMVKDCENDSYPRFRKRSYFGLRWLNSNGAYTDEIKPSNLWRVI
jgi:hypothetical protein